MNRGEKGPSILYPPNGLGTRTRQWDIDRSTFADYLNDFSIVDRKGRLPQFLERLRHLARPVVAVDLMATPYTLIDFAATQGQKEFYGFAVGTSVLNPDEPLPPGISYIHGTLQDFETRMMLEGSLGGKKVDFLMSRGYGGIPEVPANPEFYLEFIKRAWNWLNPEGSIAIFMLPPLEELEKNGVWMNQWLQSLDAVGVQYQYNPSCIPTRSDYRYGFLMLERNSQSGFSDDLPDCLNLSQRSWRKRFKRN